MFVDFLKYLSNHYSGEAGILVKIGNKWEDVVLFAHTANLHGDE